MVFSFLSWSHQIGLRTPRGSLSEGVVQLWLRKLKGKWLSFREFLLSVMTVQSLLVILRHSFWKFEFTEETMKLCCQWFAKSGDFQSSASYWIPVKSQKSPVFSFSKECTWSDSSVMTVMALPFNKHMVLNEIICVLNPCKQADWIIKEGWFQLWHLWKLWIWYSK